MGRDEHWTCSDIHHRGREAEEYPAVILVADEQARKRCHAKVGVGRVDRRRERGRRWPIQTERHEGRCQGGRDRDGDDDGGPPEGFGCGSASICHVLARRHRRCGSLLHDLDLKGSIDHLEVDHRPRVVVGLVGLDEPVGRIGDCAQSVAPGRNIRDVDRLTEQVPGVFITPTHGQPHGDVAVEPLAAGCRVVDDVGGSTWRSGRVVQVVEEAEARLHEARHDLAVHRLELVGLGPGHVPMLMRVAGELKGGVGEPFAVPAGCIVDPLPHAPVVSEWHRPVRRNEQVVVADVDDRRGEAQIDRTTLLVANKDVGQWGHAEIGVLRLNRSGQRWRWRVGCPSEYDPDRPDCNEHDDDEQGEDPEQERGTLAGLGVWHHGGKDNAPDLSVGGVVPAEGQSFLSKQKLMWLTPYGLPLLGFQAAWRLVSQSSAGSP